MNYGNYGRYNELVMGVLLWFINQHSHNWREKKLFIFRSLQSMGPVNWTEKTDGIVGISIFLAPEFIHFDVQGCDG